jgi:hypothetical protein
VEVDTHRRRRGADDPGDVADRVARVMVEHHSSSLLRRESDQGFTKHNGKVLVRGRFSTTEIDASATASELSGGNLECCPPHPSVRLADGPASLEGLSKCLRHRVARHFSITRKHEHRPPQPSAFPPVQALKASTDTAGHDDLMHIHGFRSPSGPFH